MKIEGRLRWAIFTNSVVSAMENPDAHLWRTLGRLLRQSEHEVTFFEPRGNDAVRALLQHSGSRALSEFRGRHPDIEYRTLESRRGAELVEWMTRTLATADVALITANASDDLIGWLGKLTRPHLQTFLVDTGWNGTINARPDRGEHFSEFSAIVLGDDRLSVAYQALVPNVPILTFGPLPKPDVTVDLDRDQGQALEDGCQRLTDLVVNLHVEASVARRAPLNPNGHRPH
jgi:hypothetical protein